MAGRAGKSIGKGEHNTLFIPGALQVVRLNPEPGNATLATVIKALHHQRYTMGMEGGELFRFKNWLTGSVEPQAEKREMFGQKPSLVIPRV